MAVPREEPIGPIIQEEVTKFLERLPLESWRQMKPASAWTMEVEVALRGRGQALSVAQIREFARLYLEDETFETLFDHMDPMGDAFVVGSAAKIAESILKKRRAQLAGRYGSWVVEPAAALSFAGFALAELGRKIRQGSKIENKAAYLRTMLQRKIDADIDELKKGMDQRAWKGTVFIDQIGCEDEAAKIVAIRDELGEALFAVLIAQIDELVYGPPVRLADGTLVSFTEADRRAWEALKAADFVGRKIRWEEDYGV